MTVHVNDTEPTDPMLSVALSATVDVPVPVGVPAIAPVAVFNVSPAGRPVADQVNAVIALFESVA